MNAEPNRQILLAARPVGEPKPSDFDLVEKNIPTPGDEEVLSDVLSTVLCEPLGVVRVIEQLPNGIGCSLDTV